MKKNTWLLDHAKNVYSQKGEDGILEEVLEVIKEGRGWCVEFGSWDGKHLSNTYNLMTKGWSGVFIEGSEERHKESLETFAGNNKAHSICRFVDFEGNNTLDAILAETPIPKDFTMLSIDIDGNDYHIWESLCNYRPKVVVIEYNPSIPPNIEFIQPRDMSVNQGSSALAMVNLGKSKGYELVSLTALNAIFVKKELYQLFEIADNSLEEMFVDRKNIMQIFQLYDGTLVLGGCGKLLWLDVPLNHAIQPIPKFLRLFPYSSDHWFRFTLFRILRKIIKFREKLSSQK